MRVVVVAVDPSLIHAYPGSINLHYSPPSGGRSTVGHFVKEGDTAELVASELARRIMSDRQWCPGSFQAQVSGATVMIICKDEVANVTIYGDPGVDTLKISEWGQ